MIYIYIYVYLKLYIYRYLRYNILYIFFKIPVVPHKAVAEVSKIGNL